MGYFFNSFMRDLERDRKARRKQALTKTAAAALRRRIGGVPCPRCGQEAAAARYVFPGRLPASAGVTLRKPQPVDPREMPVLCTCPDGHQWMVRNGQLLPPQPGRRVR